MVFGAGIIGLIYVFISYGVHFVSLKGLIMALAYCWGLVLAIYLMGHGLVSIPRSLFRNASISGRLRRLQSHAPRIHEHVEESFLQLEEIEAQVLELSRRKVGSARDFQDWIEELVEIANLPESQPRTATTVLTGDRTLPTVITEKYMAEITRQLIRARHSRSRYEYEWNHLVREAARTQAILDSAASKKLEFGEASASGTFWDRVTIFTPYTRHIFHYHVMPYLRILFGVVLAMASACIVWSEMVKVVLPKLSVIRLTVVHHWVGDKGDVGFAGQLIAMFWILYMCAAALISVTEVKVWRGRALVRRNTAYESAFWYAAQVARLSVPLSYNFMTFLTPEIYEETTFYKFLGQLIDLTPLGTWFDYIFPVFILVPVSATLFGLYGKVKRTMGIGANIIEDEDDNETGYATGSWREGRDLIERDLGGNSSLRRREDAISRLGGASEGSRQSAPILSIPSDRNAAGSSSPARSPVRSTARVNRPTGSARPAAYYDDEPEDENFFQSLGHRMKNTIDTLDTPQWLQDIGNGIKKPAWMGGDDDSGNRSNSGSSTGASTDIRRWFGGGGDGRIRL
jgi:hypothetical protein